MKSSGISNPNAVLSIFDGADVVTAVVVLSNPVLKWGNLSYDIEILNGMLPAKGMFKEGFQTEPDGFIRKFEIKGGRRFTSDIYFMYQETESLD